MKKFILSISIFFILILSGISYNWYMKNVSHTMTELLDQAYTFSLTESKQTEAALDRLKQQWETYEQILAITNNHAVGDGISASITAACELYQAHETALLQVELVSLRELIQKLEEDGVPLWKNIL